MWRFRSRESNFRGICLEDLFTIVIIVFFFVEKKILLKQIFRFLAIPETSIEYGFQRLQKLITRYAGDPERLSKVDII